MTCATSMPNELSDLLELAVIDAKKCEVDPKYALRMGVWHYEPSARMANSIYDTGVCHVCMAGAVLAQECEVTTAMDHNMPPGETEINDEMRAIDDMRKGDFMDAGRWLGMYLPLSLQEAAVDSMGFYDRGTRRFSWEGYLAAVEVLRENGY